MTRPPANIPDKSAALWLALPGSILLHLAVLFGVSARAAHPADAPPPLEVRLAAAAPPASPLAARTSAAPRVAEPAAALTDTSLAQSGPAVPAAPATVPDAPPAPHDEPPAVAAHPAPASVEAEAHDFTYYPQEQLDEPPHLLGDIQRVYPPRARSAGIEGYVTLSLLINERGEIDEMHVVRAQPAGFFEQSALDMLRGQRYTPAIKQSRAIRSSWQETVHFKLQG
jgi:TonB family protein